MAFVVLLFSLDDGIGMGFVELFSFCEDGIGMTSIIVFSFSVNRYLCFSIV